MHALHRFWRSLEELADDDLRDFLIHEFLYLAKPSVPGLSRRDFLTLMGASLALAGTRCMRKPASEADPFVCARAGRGGPSQSLFFATAMPCGGFAIGVLVESVMGRPIKVEGNPVIRQASAGPIALVQGAMLQLWDPSRAQAVLRGGAIDMREMFLCNLGVTNVCKYWSQIVAG